MSAATPREVVERLLRLTAEGMADLFAEDAVFEMPFLPPGTPQPEPGREAFRAHLKGAVGLQEFDSVDDVHIHDTTDPGVVVAEYRLHGRVVPTGKRFASHLVMVTRIHDGLIIRARTYANPLDSAIAFDTVHDLLTGLTTA
ncbi:nuclear transport factor 2 family protein [Streptacidiphilus griseoplanus]|uniref:nuclear transport factor 2 family protein n=1 Tax=Peterkaempfera griseoplana TaxID=66896 RepID=UPI0006E341C0|nr:nuclear transport factor 2 family protein [Peterkaempfera griseoplana]